MELGACSRAVCSSPSDAVAEWDRSFCKAKRTACLSFQRWPYGDPRALTWAAASGGATLGQVRPQ